jgi:hypothetical protein
MAAESELNNYIGRAYHAFMRDGSVKAVFREAVKDIRNTLMEFFFGKGERGGEPGAPGTPLFHDLIEARKQHSLHQSSGSKSLNQKVSSNQKGSSTMASNAQQTSITGSILENPPAHLEPQQQSGQEQQQGNVMGQESGSAPAANQEGSITAAILDNPKQFLAPEQQQSQEHERQQEHGQEM